ncbi:hypothetical protein MKQ70_19920 [Chitinophaga sedimenti]|nr:amylo-alpha-1,6-glucosidase [Chitinophaga sedimenti]MCK7557149.1 hypothetical protein [Chitinophaga sedimenti]
MYCPGTFEITLVHGEQLVIAVGQQECGRLACKRMFAHVSAELPVRHTFEEHLQHAASQFLLHDHKVPYIKAGYYWFGRWGRDTCISLPGLTLLQGNLAAFKEIVDGLLVDLKDGLIPNCGHGKNAAYNSADASLWLIWALQQYAMIYNAIEDVWEIYGAALHQILHHYKLGTSFGIGMTEDGLLQAGQDGYALTWMDAVVDGSPVTPRMGKAVEINALWYNAICFCLEAARQSGDENFTEIWSAFPERICYAFVKTFWSEEKNTSRIVLVLTGLTGPLDRTSFLPSHFHFLHSLKRSEKQYSIKYGTNCLQHGASGHFRHATIATRATIGAHRRNGTAPTTREPPGHGYWPAMRKPTCAFTNKRLCPL